MSKQVTLTITLPDSANEEDVVYRINQILQQRFGEESGVSNA